MSNLPPGVTDYMIPGCGPAEYEELTADDWDDNYAPGSWACEATGCDAEIGYYERPHPFHDYDQVAWAETWLTPDEKLVCGDCYAEAQRIAAENDAEYEAFIDRIIEAEREADQQKGVTA
jgi:hypothetical protein